MNLPECSPYFDQAVDTVVTVINLAKSRLGVRQNLTELAESRKEIASSAKVSLNQLHYPLDRTGLNFLVNSIEKTWRLTPNFMYKHRFMGTSRDETCNYFYFEVVFSQPTPSYPIPQATVTVFFRLEDNYTDPPTVDTAPTMYFRMEGQNTDHDVRYVTLTTDWLAAVLKMKIKLYQRIERLDLF